MENYFQDHDGRVIRLTRCNTMAELIRAFGFDMSPLEFEPDPVEGTALDDAFLTSIGIAP